MKANCIPRQTCSINPLQHSGLQFICFTFYSSISLATPGAISHCHPCQRLHVSWLQDQPTASCIFIIRKHYPEFKFLLLMLGFHYKYLHQTLKMFINYIANFPAVLGQLTLTQDHFFSSALVGFSICTHLVTGQHPLGMELKQLPLVIYWFTIQSSRA